MNPANSWLVRYVHQYHVNQVNPPGLMMNMFKMVVVQIFMEVEPLAGKRDVAATERRTKKDWAH